MTLSEKDQGGEGGGGGGGDTSGEHQEGLTATAAAARRFSPKGYFAEALKGLRGWNQEKVRRL
jgi:hypothetical protein